MKMKKALIWQLLLLLLSAYFNSFLKWMNGQNVKQKNTFFFLGQKSKVKFSLKYPFWALPGRDAICYTFTLPANRQVGMCICVMIDIFCLWNVWFSIHTLSIPRYLWTPPVKALVGAKKYITNEKRFLCVYQR